jgi:hypothetical protein
MEIAPHLSRPDITLVSLYVQFAARLGNHERRALAWARVGHAAICSAQVGKGLLTLRDADVGEQCASPQEGKAIAFEPAVLHIQ